MASHPSLPARFRAWSRRRRQQARPQGGQRRGVAQGMAWLLAWQSVTIPLPTTAAPGATQPTGELEPQIVAVVVNAALVSDGEVVFATPLRPGYWVDEEKLATWRLKPDTDETRVLQGKPHRLVCSNTAWALCFQDESSALLSIEAKNERFDSLRISAPAVPAAIPEAPSTWGGYLNYDLYAMRGRTEMSGGYADARAFSPFGDFYLRAGFLRQRKTHGWLAKAMGWQWDMPAIARTVQLGDLTDSGNVLRPPITLRGLRYGSDLSLRPDISLIPKPQVTGEVPRASRADLFVDGMFRRSGEVPYGRFDMEADGLLAGLGSMEVVLTDPTGQQSVQNLRYYLAPQLLSQGLHEFSLQAGRLGRDLTANGNGPWLFSAQGRYGLQRDLTLSYATSVTDSTRFAGVLADKVIGEAGVVRAGVSVMDRGEGAHARYVLGHDFQSLRFSSTVRVEATPGDRATPSLSTQGGPVTTSAANAFAVNSIAQTTLPNDRRLVYAGVSAPIGDRLQIGASWLRRTPLAGGPASALAISGSYRPGNQLQFTFGLQRVSQYTQGSDGQPGRSRGVQALVGLLVPLGGTHVVSSSVSRDGHRNTAQFSLQSIRQDLEDEHGGQYQVFGQAGAVRTLGGNYSRAERFGQWTVEGAMQDGHPQAGARLSGALGVMRDFVFATRRIEDGFVVVDSDGQPNMPVFFENRYAGTTNANGKLLIPDARAYQVNRISVDPSTLPIEFTLPEDQLEVTPRRHAGTLARFEISDGGEVVRVRRRDGSPLPAGAQAKISTQRQPAAINSRSELFINHARKPAEVQVTWPGGSCSFGYKPFDASASQAEGAEGFTCR